MQVIILGSGVIGVTSAWYLAEAGHEVTVIDRQPDCAMETSANNAGQISPGYAAPWAAPGVPLKAIKWLFQRHAPLTIRPDGSGFQLRWLWQMFANCQTKAYQCNKSRMVRIAEYSRDCLRILRQSTGISYEGRELGTLQLFRTSQQLDNASRDIAVLAEANVPYRLLQADELETVEPALATHQHKLAGGLYLPHDETGDCHLFTRDLARMAAQAGVKFRFGITAKQLICHQNRIEAVKCQDEMLTADIYVVALASYSRQLLKGIIDIPVYPVKGYSLTIPVKDPQEAPVSTIIDETYKIAITRFEERIRVGGMAEVVGFNTTLPPARRITLDMVVNDLYPGGGRFATGQLLADLISGHTPAIAVDDLSVMRYLPGFQLA